MESREVRALCRHTMEIPGGDGKWNQDGEWAVPRTWCLCYSERKCLWRVSSLHTQQGKAMGLHDGETFRKPTWDLPGIASVVENRSLKNC